ncbi:MAG: hypothetical protein ACTSQP_16560 [Promethearchaeota archaeon]
MTTLYNKNGILYVKDLMRDSYREKKIAFENFLEEKNKISLNTFVRNIFMNKCFKHSNIKKADFVLELLNDDLRIEYWIYLRDIFRNLGYLTDRRHTEEYVFDIALGWLAEEFIIEKIREYIKLNKLDERKIKFGLMGIDQEREFQNLNIKATADIYIIKNLQEQEEIYRIYKLETGKEAVHNNKETKKFLKWFKKKYYIKIDLFVDYKGTWDKNGYFDIKKGKINHFEKKELDWILAMDILNKKFYLISREQALNIELTPNPAMGNVNTAKIPLSNSIDLNEILKILIK